MIVFVPAYDEATQSNLNLAKQINFPTNFVILFEEQATRENLLKYLTESSLPLFAMSHGQRNILHSQDSDIALSIKDSSLLSQRSAYVFACHTAVELGQAISEKDGIWWGYSDSVMCYIDESSSLQFFVDTFQLIYTNFSQAKTQAEVQKLLDTIKQQCDRIQDELNNQFYENLKQGISEGSNLLAVITTIRHIWQRLRVWLPEQNEPEMHPEAPPPILPAFLF